MLVGKGQSNMTDMLEKQKTHSYLYLLGVGMEINHLLFCKIPQHQVLWKVEIDSGVSAKALVLCHES